MSKTNALETDVLRKLFQGVELPWNGVSNLHVSLHTADPGEGGDQTTSEATFTGYARQAVSRDALGWDVAGDLVSNAEDVDFPLCTGGSNAITHFGIGTAASGAGTLLFKGALTNPLAVSNGITPSFAAGALQIQED